MSPVTGCPGALEQGFDHPAVAECAVIGIHDELISDRVVSWCQGWQRHRRQHAAGGADSAVRDQIGPVAAFRDIDVVPALPKTRSGKILRKTMRSIAAGKEEPVPSTIDDVAVLDALRPLLRPVD
jgi:propionyl-CoA synthetase